MRKILTLLFLLVLYAPVLAQQQEYVTTTAPQELSNKTLDAPVIKGIVGVDPTVTLRLGNATATAPNKIGAALPTTCQIGDTFFLTSAPAGSNIYGATSASPCTWTAQGGAGGGGGDISAVGDCAAGNCFQATTATQVFAAPAGGGVATFRALTDADVPNTITLDNLTQLSTRNYVDLQNRTHVLATGAGLGPDHSISGGTAGQVFRVTGPTSAALQAIIDADLPATIVRDSRQVLAGTGLTGGGNLSADRTLAVSPDTTLQRLEVAKNGTLVGTRKQINLIEGGNITLTMADNAGSNRVDVTVIAATGGAGAGHTIMEEGTALPARNSLNFIGRGTCVDNSGANRTDCTQPAETDPVAGAVNGILKSNGAGVFSAATATDLPFTPSGTIAGNTVGAAIAELDTETQTALAASQPLDTDLTALAVNTTAGFWAAGTNVARSFASGTGITWTNPAGIAGNPQANVDSTVALTTRAFAAGNFDYDFGNAASLGVPRATGAAPTGPGRIAFNSTTGINKLVYGNGTTTLTLADTATTQPLAANLTALTGLTGVNGKIPYFTGPGTMALTSGLETPCPATGTQALNTSSVGTFVCGALSLGLTGTMVAGTIPMGVTAGTLTPSNITQSGGNINIAGGLVVGTGVSLVLDTSAITTSDKTWTVQNISGIPLVATTEGGAITDTQTAVFKTTGGITRIVNGGAAGTGTWTDSSTNTGTNKTLVDLGTADATGNAITTPIFASFDGGSLTPDGTNCTDPTGQTINSGPAQYAFVCPTPNSAIFDAVIIGIKNAVTTIRVRLKANDTVSSKALAGTFKAQCRASGTAPSSTWGSTQTVSITLTTLNITYEGLTAAITPNGTCSAGADLYIRYNATGGSNSATTRILGLVIEQLS